MPLDAVCLGALAAELAPALEGAKIDKVQQPARDTVLLTVRGKTGGGKLLLCAGTGSARVHFTRESFENPAEPPMFCMLLRKHLSGARILSLTQPNGERLLRIDLESRDEMGDQARKALIVEMIGRSSNLILVSADGHIIDCLRRMDFAGDELRRLQPGMLYRLPPRQDKADFFTLGEESAAALIEKADRETPMDRWLLAHVAGLSPLLCRELAYRCGEDWNALPGALRALREEARTPVLLLENGEPKDFSCTPVGQYGAAVENRRCESFSALLDAYYARREREELRRRRGRELLRAVKTARDRQQRKLIVQREEMAHTEDREALRRRAELVTANLYRLKKGERELRCEDYFQDDCPEITIPLDALKTPQQNAAAMYREYNRQKAAAEHLRVLIAEGEKQLDYLESAMDEVERAASEKELSELRRELTETGVLKRQKSGKPDKSRPLPPLRYVSDDGIEILVGRNNLQNDELTTKIARRTDYWLHTQKVHGSHVILRCEGREPPARSIAQAASLAVYHSRAREGGKTPVDLTMVRFVRKPSGSLPGKVLYTDYTTLIAQADEALAERLEQKK